MSSESTFFQRVSTALIYGICSFLIIVVNKIVLTTYQFPSAKVLGLGQMVTTILVLRIGKTLGFIDFAPFSVTLLRKLWPLPAFYVGNLASGLDGTKRLSLPMFTVLRRFTIPLTLIGERVVLGVRQGHLVASTVVAMVGGALVAASDDLAFDLPGYALVLTNDVCTAANNVYLKKKLEARDMGQNGLLFYNALFMAGPLFVAAWLTGELRPLLDFDGWYSPGFVLSFAGSCGMGFGLMYATMLCTAHNSALTTTIVGCLKNIFVTYVGMYLGGDYVYSLTNFVGLNISMAGSLVYSYVTFVQKKPKEPKPVENA